MELVLLDVKMIVIIVRKRNAYVQQVVKKKDGSMGF